jgi:magnesium chelatase family protein
MCSITEVERYWKKIGGALLDRIDMRIPLQPPTAETILTEDGRSSREIREGVVKARKIQADRYRNSGWDVNSRLSPGSVLSCCGLTIDARRMFAQAVEKLGLSARACHSVLKIARTIADLEESDLIGSDHLLEAVQHRRYGDGDYFWSQRF